MLGLKSGTNTTHLGRYILCYWSYFCSLFSSEGKTRIWVSTEVGGGSGKNWVSIKMTKIYCTKKKMLNGNCTQDTPECILGQWPRPLLPALRRPIFQASLHSKLHPASQGSSRCPSRAAINASNCSSRESIPLASKGTCTHMHKFIHIILKKKKKTDSYSSLTDPRSSICTEWAVLSSASEKTTFLRKFIISARTNMAVFLVNYLMVNMHLRKSSLSGSVTEFRGWTPA